MTIEHNDIIIAGGGLAGMISALAFAQAGFNTVCIDPSPPITDRADAGADLRTTAFLQPAQAFLNELGLWDKLAGHPIVCITPRTKRITICEHNEFIRIDIILFHKVVVTFEVSTTTTDWNIFF